MAKAPTAHPTPELKPEPDYESDAEPVKTKAAFKFKTKAVVTRPVLKMAAGSQYFVRIESVMHQGKQIEGSKNKEPAIVCDAVDLETGQNVLLICFTVLRKELESSYPNDSYVGKCFAIRKLRDMSKEYNHVEISEIEPE